MSILKKLEIWQSSGLIDETQKQKILAFEANTTSGRLLPLIYFISIFTIGLGIISIIAANWNSISTAVKLLSDFVLLTITASAIFKYADKPEKRGFESLILFFSLLILGSIGLIVQVFNLQSDNLSALLLWTVLTAPFLLQTQRIILPFIWFPLFFVSLADCLYNWNRDWIENLFQQIYAAFPLSIFLFCVTMASFIYIILKCFFAKRHSPVVSAAAFWLVAIWSGLVFIADNLYSADILSIVYTSSRTKYVIAAALVTWLALTSFIGFKFARSILLSKNLLFMLFMIAIYQILPENDISFELWGIILTLSLLGLCLYSTNKSLNYKMSDFIAAIIALRIFGIYLQIVGDLSMTGAGLIISGIILFLLAKLWYWFKKSHSIKRDLK